MRPLIDAGTNFQNALLDLGIERLARRRPQESLRVQRHPDLLPTRNTFA